MNLIKTKSFELATYVRGNLDSDKFALVLPGKLDTKDYPHMKSHVEFLAEQGFHALSFDPPGTWGSPGSIELYTMTNYLQAINELIEHFGKKPTLLLGHSRGGSMAMLAGTNNQFVNAFVSIMSNYSFSPEIHDGYPDDQWKNIGYKSSPRDLPDNPDNFRDFNLPYNFLKDQIQYDMSDGIRNSTIPKMFVLGKHDPIVKPEVVETAYQISATPKVFYQLDSDHNYRYKPQLIDQVNQYLGEFIERYSL